MLSPTRICDVTATCGSKRTERPAQRHTASGACKQIPISLSNLPPTRQHVLSYAVWSFQPEFMLILNSLQKKGKIKDVLLLCIPEMRPAEMEQQQC